MIYELLTHNREHILVIILYVHTTGRFLRYLIVLLLLVHVRILKVSVAVGHLMMDHVVHTIVRLPRVGRVHLLYAVIVVRDLSRHLGSAIAVEMRIAMLTVAIAMSGGG